MTGRAFFFLLALAGAAAAPLWSQAETPISPGFVPEPVVTPAPAPQREGRIGLRLYLGGGGGAQWASFDVTDGPKRSESASVAGVDVYAFWSPWRRFGFIANYSNLAGSDSDRGDYRTVVLDAGIAYALPIGPFMPWVAAKAGTARLSYSNPNIEESAYAFDYGVDLGSDFRYKSLLFGLRWEFRVADFQFKSWSVSSRSTDFIAMVGWRF